MQCLLFIGVLSFDKFIMVQLVYIIYFLVYLIYDDPKVFLPVV